MSRGRLDLTPAIAYVQVHYANNIKVAELAHAAFVSKYHFTRVFTTQYGCTPMEFVQRYRMHMAAHLLATTNATVASIMDAVGYHSIGTASSRFTGVHGCSPTTYRERHRTYASMSS
jgi:AraC-like DNA-binding protein